MLGGGGLGDMIGGGYYYGGVDGNRPDIGYPHLAGGIGADFFHINRPDFRFSPANRAVKISALEAIKHE